MTLHLGVSCAGVSEVLLSPGASSREDHAQSPGSPRLHVFCQSHRPERPPAAARAGTQYRLCTTPILSASLTHVTIGTFTNALISDMRKVEIVLIYLFTKYSVD